MLGQGLRARLATIAVALSLTISAVPANADELDLGLIDATSDESASLWFVELATAPTSEGNSATAVDASKSAFRTAARAKGAAYTERYAYGDLWNGFSVSATGATIAKLQRLPGVRAVWPVATMTLADPGAGADETIDLATATAMTGADYVQDTLGFTGKNIKVAVIDTGVDYHNPDLGGCFGASCRVIAGYDFVGNAFNFDAASIAYNPTAVPDPDPDDCNGHGTHVAGIVGAKGDVIGVAPDVRFGAYRVFGCDGSTSADIMLAAMERALADGMDVINMSIGSAFQWPQYPTALAADRLVGKHGIVVVASIGNNGANGLYAAGAPGVGEKVIGVASFDNTFAAQPAFAVAPDGRLVGYTRATGAPVAPLAGTFDLARTGTQTSVADACNATMTTPSFAPAPGSLTGKVAVIRRGTCGFYEKARNAQLAGAIAVVLYNNAAGLLTPTVAGSPAVTIPVVMATQADGNLMDTRLAAGPVSLSWTDQTTSTQLATGNIISSFSSYGLTADLGFKPDIAAPGGSIYSTVPLELGAHGPNSGTSMSSPHVAGAVALLLQASPKSLRELGAESVRARLQNTAAPRNRTTNPANGLDNVHRQGAGMLDIKAAIEATAEVTPSKLALGESQSGPAMRVLTLRSLPGTGKSVTYTLSHAPAASTGPDTFAPSFSTTGAATVSFDSPTVTVKNNQSATVTVTITANASLVDRSLYGGYIVLSGDNGSVLRVPYAGFKGDYQTIQVLTNVAGLGGVPGLAARQIGYVSNAGAIASQFAGIPATYGFTMAPKPNVAIPVTCPLCGFGPTTFLDVPYYLAHFNHQTRLATFTAYDATGTNALGEAFHVDFVGRNTSATTFFSFGWDGLVGPAEAQTQLPNGEYVMKLTVLKALGDASNASHSETFTFGKVNIQSVP
jgi:minor extracellular serine protease Vpr